MSEKVGPSDELNRRTALYRFYDRDGGLLYIGVTHDLVARWRQHRLEKPWWGDVAERTVEWFEHRREALAAESAAINSEQPEHNEVHNRTLLRQRGLTLQEEREDDASRPREEHEMHLGYGQLRVHRAEARGDHAWADRWRRMIAEVDKAPPLTDAQKAQLRILLQSNAKLPGRSWRRDSPPED